jgi:poly-gamma-glutamate biosynthesis protein PgsC/CapC
MTGLAPEVSALVISLGLVLSLVCYLVTNLSPGGMITPGWLALAFIVQPLLALLIIAVVIATYVVCQWLQRVVILYGKRLFATVVLVAVFFQLTAFIFIVQHSSVFYDATTLGFIVPGLVAYQLIRQPVVATITATATVTMVAYCVMLAGILLRMVPIEGHAAANGIAASPSAPVSSLHLAVGGLGVALILAVIGRQSRRVRSASEADPTDGEIVRPLRPRLRLAGVGRVLSAVLGVTFVSLTALAGRGRSVAVRAGTGAQRVIALLPSVLSSTAVALTGLGRFAHARSRLALHHTRQLLTRPSTPRIPALVTRRARSVNGSGVIKVTPRYRESLIILASIAAGFAIYFGFGRPDQAPTQREQVPHTPFGHTADETIPSAPAARLVASRSGRAGG